MNDSVFFHFITIFIYLGLPSFWGGLVSLAKGLPILFIFIKNTFFILLIFCMIFSLCFLFVCFEYYFFPSTILCLVYSFLSSSLSFILGCFQFFVFFFFNLSVSLFFFSNMRIEYMVSVMLGNIVPCELCPSLFFFFDEGANCYKIPSYNCFADSQDFGIIFSDSFVSRN